MDIQVPIMGEGLREAQIVSLLVPDGSIVEKNAPLFEIETDKSSVTVESPGAGLVNWQVQVGDTVPLGQVIGTINGSENSNPSTMVMIPPKTRHYGIEKGLSIAQLRQIRPQSGHTLLPSDVDLFFGHSSSKPVEPPPLSQSREALIRQFHRSSQQVIPASVTAHFDHPTQTDAAWLCYQLVKSLNHHPNLCITSQGNIPVKGRFPIIGLAVSTTQDDVVIAKMEWASDLGYPAFRDGYQTAVQLALSGENAADNTIQVTISHLGSAPIVSAVPTLVAPACMSVYLGRFKDQLVVSITFDHRFINGLQITRWLHTIERALSEQIDPPTPVTNDEAGIQLWLMGYLRQLGFEPSPTTPFGDLGLASIQSVTMIQSLSDALNIPLSPLLSWEFSNCQALASHIASEIRAKKGLSHDQ